MTVELGERRDHEAPSGEYASFDITQPVADQRAQSRKPLGRVLRWRDDGL
jgi:hypothetical protein